MKCASNDDSCTLRLTDEPDTITFVFEDPNKDKQQEVEVKLMDLDTDQLGIPEQDYSCVVTMPSSEFQKVCRDLSTFGDSLSVVATKNGVQFEGKGDTGSSKVRFGQTAASKDDEIGVTIELHEPVNITFAIKYMNSFTKATPLSPAVTLSMSNDVPIVVEYKLEDFGYLRFYLAPKIEEEDMQAEN